MKIAITTSGTNLDSPLELRFGRAAAFLVYDTDHDTFEMADNRQNMNAAQGAGIQAAQNAASTGAKAVISGHCGPKAFRVLSASKIAVYTTEAHTVRDAIRHYLDGTLTPEQSADVEGHWE